MLDLKAIREDPEAFRAGLTRRGAAESMDRLLELDSKRRQILPRVEELRRERNEVSDQIAQAKQAGEDAEAAITAMRAVGGEIKGLESDLAEVESERDRLALELPNLPHPDVPEGDTDEDAVCLREVGDKPSFDFELRDHLEIGTAAGLIDMERASQTSGARFAYLMGDIVVLQMALVGLAQRITAAHGFKPVVPPVLVREQALEGTGFFPGEREMIYEVERDELFLVGTSEVALASLHADEILDAEQLPLRYAGISTCFRREAGAAGKDTRGIFRVHQFDKVEMFSFVTPDQSEAEHERILSIEEEILQTLEIPYRVVDIPLGDLGAPAARKFDCEAWIPSQERYREVTSTSNTTDYQARRLGARYRPSADASPEVLHTLNGTAVAVGRILIALMENHQCADGSVELPAALVAAGSPERIAVPSEG